MDIGFQGQLIAPPGRSLSGFCEVLHEFMDDVFRMLCLSEASDSIIRSHQLFEKSYATHMRNLRTVYLY